MNYSTGSSTFFFVTVLLTVTWPEENVEKRTRHSEIGNIGGPAEIARSASPRATLNPILDCHKNNNVTLRQCRSDLNVQSNLGELKDFFVCIRPNLFGDCVIGFG